MADKVRTNQSLQDRGLIPLYSTSKNGDSFAIVKQTFDNSVIPSTQGLPTFHSKLKSFPFGSRIGLSVLGRIAWKCSQCAHPWVRAASTGVLTLWHCEKCNAPRLAQGRKPDKKLVRELLSHPGLKGWQKLFTREMHRKERLSPSQREKLQTIAEALGITLQENCSLSDLEGVGL